ncbi:MAG: EAL domain-containing protein [Sulfurospirillaceae bacterium]|nr:EAL domain-containing protein [Sulfurospirillaceae bacterium]
MLKNAKLFLNFFMIITIICLFISIEKDEKTVSVIFAFLLFGLVLYSLIRAISFKPLQKTEYSNSDKAYLNAFENSASIAKIGLDLQIKYVNRSFCQLTLSTKEECLNKGLDSFLQDQQDVYTEICETLKQNQSWDGILMLTVKHNNQAHVKCTIEPIKDNNGALIEFLLIAHDLTELAISKKIIQDKMYIDSQTKLPNRLQLIKEKIKLLNKHSMTLILINIDSFQAINSIYGNQIGDEVLIATANWLKANLPCTEAKLFKLEADVFAIFIPAPYEEEELKTYLNEMSKKISKEGLLCSGIGINITFTIGAAQGEADLLKLASIAYKVAKKDQKSFWIYDIKSNKEEEYIQSIKTIHLLKKALKEDQIIPYFQPILNLKNNHIDKYETLMRIKKDDGSVHTPNEFLNIAKHSKLYPAISRDIIGKAFDTFRFSSNQFSINLSFLDISNQHTLDFIFEKMSEYTIGSWVIFEIVESEGINNYHTILQFIEKAKSYGAKIAIDDFGSGYSNFERLVKLQPDFIKIDGGLIKNIDKNDDMKIITQTIVNFSNKLGAKTIAEYVHSQEIFDIIKKMGVDYAQGFHIGKPSPILDNNNNFIKNLIL